MIVALGVPLPWDIQKAKGVEVKNEDTHRVVDKRRCDEG